MNVLSINIRGMGDVGKISWVKRLKLNHKINFIGTQETWMGDYSKIDVRGCWDSADFESDGVDAVGRSGGLICIWNKLLFSKMDVIKDRYFLAVVGKWQGNPENLIFVNVYGPYSS